jgi:hypothetical protein
VLIGWVIQTLRLHKDSPYPTKMNAKDRAAQNCWQHL